MYAGTFQKYLDKINNVEKMAKRIVTGATKGCSSALLNIEAKWEDISTRRKNSILIMLYKIQNGDAPTNLMNIYNQLKQECTQVTNYNLRNVHLRVPICKTKQYENTFFPLAFKFWNLLPVEAKTKPTLNSFKFYLKKKDKPKKLYYVGNRMLSVYHARLRMGCSSLNSHLALILHVKDNPSCTCGHVVMYLNPQNIIY